MIKEVIFLDYFSSLINGDKTKCSAILAYLLEQNISLTDLYNNLFKRSLYRVGRMWEANKICVATEHNAVSITECLMNFTLPLSSAPRNGKKAVITSAPKEFHQIGARMASDVLESMGWETYFLGANTPVNELLKIIDHREPDLLGFSVSTYFNVNRLLNAINIIKNRFSGLEIIVGGQAIDSEYEKILNSIYGVEYIPDLASLQSYINLIPK